MGLKQTTAPTVWPVTLEEAKSQCRVLHDSEDTYISGLIKSATSHVENALGKSVAAQGWTLTLDDFKDRIELYRGPVVSVTSVTYEDANGTTQTADASLYTADLSGERNFIVRNSGTSWPQTEDAVGAVRVVYTTGMNPVPQDIKHAILLLVSHWYANREPVVVGSISSNIPYALDSLLQPYRLVIV